VLKLQFGSWTGMVQRENYAKKHNADAKLGWYRYGYFSWGGENIVINCAKR